MRVAKRRCRRHLSPVLGPAGWVFSELAVRARRRRPPPPTERTAHGSQNTRTLPRFTESSFNTAILCSQVLPRKITPYWCSWEVHNGEKSETNDKGLCNSPHTVLLRRLFILPPLQFGPFFSVPSAKDNTMIKFYQCNAGGFLSTMRGDNSSFCWLFCCVALLALMKIKADILHALCKQE